MLTMRSICLKCDPTYTKSANYIQYSPGGCAVPKAGLSRMETPTGLRKPDNLFATVPGLHSEQGPFTDRSETRRPHLWHVRNHNAWINGLGLALFVALFAAGYWIGSNGAGL